MPNENNTYEAIMIGDLLARRDVIREILNTPNYDMNIDSLIAEAIVIDGKLIEFYRKQMDNYE